MKSLTEDVLQDVYCLLKSFIFVTKNSLCRFNIFITMKLNIDKLSMFIQIIFKLRMC